MLEIQHHIPLKQHNSFQVECVAQHYVEIASLEDFIALTQTDLWSATRNRLILWGGSNILLTQPSYAGIVVVNKIMGKEVLRTTDTQVYIEVWAGENRNDFVTWTLAQGYCWLENLISIPGTVGWAPIQNIWAYGIEVGEKIASVTWYDWLVHRTKHLPHDECLFGYRDSLFKSVLSQRFFVSQVVFCLDIYRPETYIANNSYGDVAAHLAQGWITQATPSQIAQSIAAIRASKLPNRKELGTAGSFFKNPVVSKEKAETLQQQTPELKIFPLNDKFVKLSAGQLIDLAWLKWYSTGSAGTYEKHALVVVNHGDASGQELLQVVSHIQDTVSQTFGVQLQPEVRLV